MRKILIIGLGNPGQEYSETRHNLGFMVVDHLGREAGFSSWKRKNLSEISRGSLDSCEVVLGKPQTYMNLSGNAVLSLMSIFGVPPESLLVVYDDIALPFGRIRIRPSGSSGGHKGLESIIEKTGRTDIPRLRVGIGSPPEGMDSARYVLQRFNSSERKVLPELIESSVSCIRLYIREGIDSAMNRFNSVLSVENEK